MHTHAHVHAHTCSHMHIRTHAHAHTHRHTHTWAHVHTLRMCTHTHTHVHIHTCTRTHSHTHMMHTHMHAHMHLHTCTLTYRYTCTHSCAHIHTLMVRWGDTRVIEETKGHSSETCVGREQGLCVLGQHPTLLCRGALRSPHSKTWGKLAILCCGFQICVSGLLTQLCSRGCFRILVLFVSFRLSQALKYSACQAPCPGVPTFSGCGC